MIDSKSGKSRDIFAGSQHRAGALTSKPTWSVLSLQALNEAIWQAQQPDDPWRLHEEAAQIERLRLQAIAAYDQKLMAKVRAMRNYYLDPLENT